MQQALSRTRTQQALSPQMPALMVTMCGADAGPTTAWQSAAVGQSQEKARDVTTVHIASPTSLRARAMVREPPRRSSSSLAVRGAECFYLFRSGRTKIVLADMIRSSSELSAAALTMTIRDQCTNANKSAVRLRSSKALRKSLIRRFYPWTQHEYAPTAKVRMQVVSVSVKSATVKPHVPRMTMPMRATPSWKERLPPRLPTSFVSGHVTQANSPSKRNRRQSSAANRTHLTSLRLVSALAIQRRIVSIGAPLEVVTMNA
mmetsp:Transcript_74661/g.132075  ORF Transcript_74661/g.132075 Transcript_74661/m.132075 type:complete len:260 (+) Transcript_74661:548-1327(+)